jgi:hypothetical protein
MGSFRKALLSAFEEYFIHPIFNSISFVHDEKMLDRPTELKEPHISTFKKRNVLFFAMLWHS